MRKPKKADEEEKKENDEEDDGVKDEEEIEDHIIDELQNDVKNFYEKWEKDVSEFSKFII